MMKIILIQFRLNPVAIQMEIKSISRELGPGIELNTLSALEDLINWKDAINLLGDNKGVIFGGSGDFDFDGGRSSNDEAKYMSLFLLEKLKPLLNFIFENDIPTLGICYGHQIIAAFAGGVIANDIKQKKNGSHLVQILASMENHLIFKDIPTQFYAHYLHKDSLTQLPKGATLLISGGEVCKYSTLKYRNNIFTTQFHPELTLEDVNLRMEAYPNYLPVGELVEDVFKIDTNSNKILQNFGQLVENITLK